MKTRFALFTILALMLSCQSQKADQSISSEANSTNDKAKQENAAQKNNQRKRLEMAPLVDGKLQWAGDIPWVSFEDAKKAATEQKKPFLLIVYSNGCPRCRELAAAMKDPEWAKEAQKISMVKTTPEEAVSLNGIIGKYGSYVPRIFLFDKEGNLREDLIGDHPRYPYFYPVPMLPKLRENIQKLLD